MSATEWIAMAEEMLHDPELGSTMRWKRITRTENPATGEVTQQTAIASFMGALVEPVKLRLFSDSTLASASTAVLARPQDFPSWTPTNLDEVEIATNQWLRVLEIKTVSAPGGTAAPVPVLIIAALGAA
ncbi:MAG: hypothetical protein WAT39_23990 [Planctomycetota bacterium]